MTKVSVEIDGEIFESVKEAAKFLEIDANYLSGKLSANPETKIKGFTVKKFKPSTDDKYKVICKETGEVFKSIHACAKAIGVYSFNIYASIKNRGYYNKNGMTYFRLAEDSPLLEQIKEKEQQPSKKLEQPQRKVLTLPNKPKQSIPVEKKIEKKVEEVKQTLSAEQILVNTIKQMLDKKDYKTASTILNVLITHEGELR